MSRLFKFEIKRMKYKKIHIILPLIIISIGLVGIITGNAFNENLTSMSIPWWRSHPIHENRATESICTEPCNPLLRATKSMKRATSTY